MLALPICGVNTMDFGGRVDKKCEVFGDVSLHGNFDILLVIITVNGQSTVVLPFKVH